MIPKIDMVRIYETVLSIPGMSDNIKIGLSISRKNVLLLNKVIKRGLLPKDADEKAANVIDLLPAESVQELHQLAVENSRKGKPD